MGTAIVIFLKMCVIW